MGKQITLKIQTLQGSVLEQFPFVFVFVTKQKCLWACFYAVSSTLLASQGTS